MDGGECDASSWLSPMQQRITRDKTDGCDDEDSGDESEGGEPADKYPEDAEDSGDEDAEGDLSEEEYDVPDAPAEGSDEILGAPGDTGDDADEDEDDDFGPTVAGGGARGLRAPSPITLKDVDLAMSVPGGSGPSDSSSLLGDLATLGAMGPSADAGGAGAAESESAASQIKTIVLKSSRRAEGPAAPSASDDGDGGDYDGDGGDGDDDFFA